MGELFKHSGKWLFLKGFGSVLDLSGNAFGEIELPFEDTVSEAWSMVGNSLRTAFDEQEKEISF